jgi:hypothetical protein
MKKLFVFILLFITLSLNATTLTCDFGTLATGFSFINGVPPTGWTKARSSVTAEDITKYSYNGYCKTIYGGYLRHGYELSTADKLSHVSSITFYLETKDSGDKLYVKIYNSNNALIKKMTFSHSVNTENAIHIDLSTIKDTTNTYLISEMNDIYIGFRASLFFTGDKGVYLDDISIEYGETEVAPDAPTFSVDEGNYYADQSLTLASATEGASIYYTLDGSTPTSASTLYSSAIAITSPTTVKAIAIKNGLSSAVVSKKIGVYKPESEYTSTFTFGSSLGLNDGASIKKVVDNAATITFSRGTANTNPRWNASGNSVTFVAGNNITVTPSLIDGVITNLTLHYDDGTSQICGSLPAMTSKMDVNVGNLTSIDLEYRVPKPVANNLAEIIDNGVRGECYKINSTTYGIYQTGNLLYAKDHNGFTNKSVLPDPYTWNSHDDSPAQFDQSNWLVLKINDGLDYSKKDIEGGLIGQLNAGSETPQLDVANTISAANSSDAYVPNTYRIYNCLGNADNFFVEPKVNEYARVKWALVMESGGVRYIHEMDKDLEHKIKIDESLYTDQTNKIITGEAYLLEGIMGTQTKASGAAEFSSSRIKANIPSTKEWVIYPTKIVKITTGTDETDIAQNTTKIFSGTGCINVSTATEGTSNVQIFDAMGRLVRNVTINGNRSIDVPAGYYIVKNGIAKGQAIIVK